MSMNVKLSDIRLLTNLSKKLSNDELIFIIQNGNDKIIQILTEILYNCTHNSEIFKLIAKKRQFKKMR